MYRTGLRERKLITDEPMDRLGELISDADRPWFIETQLGASLSLGDSDGVYALGESALSTLPAR